MSQPPPPSSRLVRALREDVSAQAGELVTRLATLLRTAQLHGLNNELWQVHLAPLHAALATLLRAESSATLEAVHGQLVVNGFPLKPSFADVNVFRYLAEQLAGRRIRQLQFERLPEEAGLQRLVVLLAAHPADGSRPLAALAQALQEQELEGIRFEEDAGAQQARSGPRTRQEEAVFLFLRGVAVVREAMEGLRAGRSVGFRRARRFVQDAVDLLLADRGLALSLTTLKNCGDYLYSHPVNVCLLTLALGQALELDKRELAQLGLSALLRDVGKATLGPGLRNKRGELSAEEWREFQRFPYAAVMGLLRFRGLNEATLRHILVAFEHPLRVTGGRTVTGREPGFYTKLIQLADGYDAMTTPRPYRKRPMLPYEALSTLVRERNLTRADPLLLRAFIHAIGLYPVGSVLLLDTGELAIVCEPPSGPDALARPRVRIISDRAGRPLGEPRLSDTAGPDEAGAALPRIAKLVEPWRHGLNVSRYLLGLAVP